MPLDFPSSPTVGQQYLNWTWNGVAWVVVPGPPLASLAQSAQNAGRNYLDNALFNIQQRGAGPWTASGNYTADRYVIFTNLDTVSVSVIALTDAQRTQIGDESANWGLQNSFTGNAGAAAFDVIQQKLEKVQRLSGKTITVSFWAVSPTNLQLGISVDQNFGTGGSPSAVVNGNGQAVSLSSTFARYQVTVNVPSVAGKTFGTNGDDFTTISFWCSTGSTTAPRSGIGVQSGVITLWGMQVEVGSQATPLEKLVPEVDLARCMRCYQLLGGLQISAYAPQAGSFTTESITFNAQMRAVPTATVLGLSPGSGVTAVNVGASSASVAQSFITTNAAVSSAFATFNLSLSADL